MTEIEKKDAMIGWLCRKLVRLIKCDRCPIKQDCDNEPFLTCFKMWRKGAEKAVEDADRERA